MIQSNENYQFLVVVTHIFMEQKISYPPSV